MRRLVCDEGIQQFQEPIVEENKHYLEVIDEVVKIEVASRVSYSGLPPYVLEFTQADLTGFTLLVPHALGAVKKIVNLTIVDDTGEEVEPTAIEFVTDNFALVSLEGFTPILNTWTVRAI